MPNETQEYEFHDIEAFSKTNEALARMQQYFKHVPNFKDKHGYEFGRLACSMLQKTRKAVDTARTDKTEDYREKVKLINGEGKRIIDTISKIEAPYREAKKEEDDRAEIEKQQRLARLDKKVDGIREFVTQAKGQDSEEISILIDMVTNIDTTQDFYDRTKEAGLARKETLEEMGQLLQDRIAFETSEADRIKAEKEAAKVKRDSEIQNKISQIQTIPNSLFGATCERIQQVINETNDMPFTDEIYGGRFEEARTTAATVLGQLESMMTMQKNVEDAEAIKAADAARIAEEEAQQEEELAEVEESHATEDIPLESYETESQALEINEGGEKPAVSAGGQYHGLNNPNPKVDGEKIADMDCMLSLITELERVSENQYAGQTEKGVEVLSDAYTAIENVIADLKDGTQNL